MKVNDGDFVMPGDTLGIIEQYLPGEGTYDDEGNIKSSVLGNVNINLEKRKISVIGKSEKPPILKEGDIIYGQIRDIKNQRVTVDIDRLKNTERSLAIPYMGTIHISKAKEGYLEKLSDAFRIGDIIEAKVVKVTSDNVDLSTTDENCGVIKAICTRCRNYMKPTGKNRELQCVNCLKKEKREVSNNYVN